MIKLLIAALVLVSAFFVFLKRKEPPKEVQVKEEAVIKATEPEEPEESEISQTPIDSYRVSMATSTTVAPATTEDLAAAVQELQASSGPVANEDAEEKDEPRENVDQTVVGNEKKLAAARSAEEVYDLLHKLRIRPKKLGEISKPAAANDYSKFWGSYEGSALNNRNEVVYAMKIDLVPPASGAKSNVIGKYQLAKSGSAPSVNEFTGDNGAQLVGRDAIVIAAGKGESHFQLYKLDNGYLAGNYYEKTSRRLRTYRFVLKKNN